MINFGLTQKNILFLLLTKNFSLAMNQLKNLIYSYITNKYIKEPNIIIMN